MQKKVKSEDVKEPQYDKFYSIKRCKSGYAIYDQQGKQISTEDVWPNVIRRLEILLRKEAGI